MSNVKDVDLPRHPWDTPPFLLIVSPTLPVQSVDEYVHTYARSITWQPNEKRLTIFVGAPLKIFLSAFFDFTVHNVYWGPYATGRLRGDDGKISLCDQRDDLIRQHIYVISGLRLPSSCRSRRENKLFEVVRKTWVLSFNYFHFSSLSSKNIG